MSRSFWTRSTTRSASVFYCLQIYVWSLQQLLCRKDWSPPSYSLVWTLETSTFSWWPFKKQEKAHSCWTTHNWHRSWGIVHWLRGDWKGKIKKRFLSEDQRESSYKKTCPFAQRPRIFHTTKSILVCHVIRSLEWGVYGKQLMYANAEECELFLLSFMQAKILFTCSNVWSWR